MRLCPIIFSNSKTGLTHGAEIHTDVSRREIMALLGQARLFVLHSQEESQGIALCEALAAGLPVVATQVGGIPFVVSEGKDGLLVPYGDVKAFADAIVTLLSDDALHDRMSAQAKLSAQRFDWGAIAAEVMKVYARARLP